MFILDVSQISFLDLFLNLWVVIVVSILIDVDFTRQLVADVFDLIYLLIL